MNTEKNKKIPIVSAIDKNYVSIYSVFLASAIEHININLNYEFIILVDSIPDKMLYMLQTQVQHLDNVTLSILDMSDIQIENQNNFTIFPKSASYRLFIPNILTNYEKVIYLDSDVIIMDDLSEVFYLLKDEYVAAVLDYGMNGLINTKNISSNWSGNYCNAETYYLKYCHLDKSLLSKYFNSGMMVLNLEKMRKNNVVSQSTELLFNKKFSFPDQDILNILFKGDIKILSQEWNFIPYENKKLKFSNEITIQREHAVHQIKILHFAGDKPWKVRDVQFEEFFWYYARKSLFYEYLLQNKNNTIETNMSIIKSLKNNYLFKILKEKCPVCYKIIKKIYHNIKSTVSLLH